MIRWSGWLLAGLVVLWSVMVYNAPSAATEGDLYRIIYVHVPCAFMAYLGFLVTAVGGALYLWKGDERFDRVANASARVGLVFCTLVVVTGPIWGRARWGPGNWWTWDPRLTVTAIQWFVYLAYVLLRRFTEGSERTARFAAVYGIVASLSIPLNRWAIDLFGGRGAHPANLASDSLGEGIFLPFAVSVATALATFLHLLLLRLDLETRRASAAAVAGGLAPDQGNRPQVGVRGGN